MASDYCGGCGRRCQTQLRTRRHGKQLRSIRGEKEVVDLELLKESLCYGDVVVAMNDLGPAFVAITFFHFKQLVFDDTHADRFAGEDLVQARDEFFNFLVFVNDLVSFQAGESLQTHFENRFRLDLRQAETSPSNLSWQSSGSLELRINAITSSR